MPPPGLLRLNERTQRPNVCINFIKPLDSASPHDQEIAKEFLERIAAQCYPVMKKNHLTVMSLEEHEWNKEFVGRNFNAGECIELVLKDRTGRWLSFRFVQFVMMHELAHCKQMNHSRSFWKVRNEYADQMKGLMAKKYTGEGLWGRGQDLSSGVFMHEHTPASADMPEHECGGVYRTARGKKRKRGQDNAGKPKETYAERQQKRIKKKFGHLGEGHAVGADELVRGGLEKKRSAAKPRVVNSKRGRELRANAALARFEAAKQQQQPVPNQSTTSGANEDSDTDSDDDDDDFADGLSIMNTLERIKDQKGRDMYKVCGNEDEQDEDAQDEQDDLKLMEGASAQDAATALRETSVETATVQGDSETESEEDTSHEASTNEAETAPTDAAASSAWGFDNVTTCPICSLENEPQATTCVACSHVLKASLIPNHWRCSSDVCKGSAYINAGDVGRCGVCGAAKPATAVMTATRPIGVVGADVLRWD